MLIFRKKIVALTSALFAAFLLVFAFQNASPSAPAARVQWADASNPNESVNGVEVILQYDEPSLNILTVRKVRGYQDPATLENPTHSLKILNAAGAIIKEVPFEVEQETYGGPLQNESEIDSEHAAHHVVRLRKQRIGVSTELPGDGRKIQIYTNDNQLLDQYDIPARFIESPRVPIQKIRGDEFLKQLGNKTSSLLIPKKLEFVFQLFRMGINDAQADAYHVDLVFVGDRYTSAQLATFSADVDRFIAKLLSVEPYKSNAAKFSFYKVMNTSSLACNYDPANPRLLLCDNAKVTAAVNNAGMTYDKIAVIVNSNSYGGSGGNISVAYNGADWGAEVFVHEFGHSFAGLKDEYVNFSTNGKITSTAVKNCYQGNPPAIEWSGIADSSSYHLGCNYPNYYRSSSSSVMRVLDTFYFNAVSQNITSTRVADFICTVSAPQSLTGIKDTSNSVTLNWLAPATGTPSKYKIYRNNVYIGYTTTSLTYTNKRLAAGTYSYFIRAVDAKSRESSNSNQIQFQIY